MARNIHGSSLIFFRFW